MGKYSDSPEWADVTPLPLDEGGTQPLAAIAYSDEYRETMSYLRAAMAANEHSTRVLHLTEDLIALNPAHYTVWLYRATVLFAIEADLRAELAWLNEIALAHQKNYQIWHHRNLIVDRLGDSSGERAFVQSMFDLDAKNYHVWSYRQWLVRRFGLWDQEELDFTARMLQQDVRNNSVWNHRWFVINGRPGHTESHKYTPDITNTEVSKQEIDFATNAIARAPQNPSPWSYIRGVAKHAGLPLSGFRHLAQTYADLSRPADGVRSSHALDLLADILAEDGVSGRSEACTALDLLAQRYDPIRRNYWEYRKGLLESDSFGVTTGA